MKKCDASLAAFDQADKGIAIVETTFRGRRANNPSIHFTLQRYILANDKPASTISHGKRKVK